MKQNKSICAYGLYLVGLLANHVDCHELAIELIGKAIHLRGDVPKFYNSLGIALRNRGRLEEAKASYERALAIKPGFAEAHNNLGAVLHAQGKPGEAETHYRHALVIRPVYAEAHNNLGKILQMRHRLDEAVEQFRQALDADPCLFEARDSIDMILKIQEKIETEIIDCKRAVIMNPAESAAHNKLMSNLYWMASFGRREWAIGQAAEWAKICLDHPLARHTLDALRGENHETPSRIPDGYAEIHFDDFASCFDETLANLNYRAPALIGEAIARELPLTGLDVADAGCGTGLAGILLRPRARSLTGIDLSGEMLAHAARRQLYDHLHKAEMISFLAARPASFDLIVAADVLVYFGDLAPALTSAQTALRPGGWMAFTVEQNVDALSHDWCLLPHGRYCHSEAYLRQCLADAGLAGVSFGSGVLRREMGLDVSGFVVLARRARGG